MVIVRSATQGQMCQLLHTCLGRSSHGPVRQVILSPISHTKKRRLGGAAWPESSEAGTHTLACWIAEAPFSSSSRREEQPLPLRALCLHTPLTQHRRPGSPSSQRLLPAAICFKAGVDGKGKARLREDLLRPEL